MFTWYNKIEGDNQMFGARYSLFEVALSGLKFIMYSVNCSVRSNADNATIVGLEGGGGCTPTSINVHPDCVTLRVDCHGHNIPSKEKRNATVKPRQFSEKSQVMGERFKGMLDTVAVYN